MILGCVDDADAKDQEHQRRINEVEDNTSLVTLTPWLRRTKWHERYKGKDMRALYEWTVSPKPDENDEIFIWKSIDRMVRKCWSGFHDCSARGWELIPFWLASAVRGKEDTRPFRSYIAPYTLRRYISYWQRYVLFCFRTIDVLEFTAQQLQLIKRIRRSIENNSYDNERELDNALLELCTSLICHSDYSHVESSLIYFCGIMGYNVDHKRWRQPQDYTTILAGLQFCIRIIILESALPSEYRDEFSEDSIINPVEQFCNVREKWLIDGEGNPIYIVINNRHAIWIHPSFAQLWHICQ